jgi:hypothetical protein
LCSKEPKDDLRAGAVAQAAELLTSKREAQAPVLQKKKKKFKTLLIGKKQIMEWTKQF